MTTAPRNFVRRLFSKSQTAPDKKTMAGRTMRSYMVMPGQAVWMSRDYQQFSDEAYGKNVVAYRAMNMVASAAASVPTILYSIN